MQYGRTEPIVPGWQAVRGIIGDAMTEIINGTDVQAALDAAVKATNTKLANQ